MARLQKSGRNRILFGVAGGIAEYLRMDPVIVRVLFILLVFANGVGVVIYLILALLMPRPETATTRPLEVVKENLRTAPRETTETGRRAVQVLRGPTGPSSTETGQPPESPGEGTAAH